MGGTKITNQTAEKRQGAFTITELLVVIAVIAFVLLLLLSQLARRYAKSSRASCENNLKQIALACRTWEGDFGDHFPMNVPDHVGGAMESCLNGNSYRTFQVMSNEINNPRILTCPHDSITMAAASSFETLRGSNISYFIGIDADEAFPNRILSGDRNLACDLQPANGLLNLTLKHPVQWFPKRHEGSGFFPSAIGYVALADGSVQEVTAKQLNELLAKTGLPTNRLALP